MTKQYGILAFPAKHSLSPLVHNAAFKALKIDAQYGLFELKDEELSAFIKQVKNDYISGFSVSLPHKESIIKYLNVVDEDAQKIGAVNTVINEGEILHGYNTDFVGSNQALKEIVGGLSGKKVVILGAGGATRAVIYGLLKEKAEVLAILNRTPEHAFNLAKEFSKMFGVKIESGSLENLHERSFQADILIQTTSIWTLNPNMTEQELPEFCSTEFVENFDVVMDIIYRPRITPLLQVAQRLGKKIIAGDLMFLYQAAKQFELWTKQKAPIEIMREVLEKTF